MKHVDKTVPLTASEGIVLRYGSFYGPGASEVLLDVMRKRQVPVVGGGNGTWSFIEITDAAAATLAAVDRGGPGSTTSWTATRRRWRSGCRTWPTSWARSRPCGCPPG
jgi:nucleoside-diphosphate-sugar epimerase